MLNCVFLIPIDHRGIQGQCFEQYLELQTWCNKNNSAIFSCNGLFLNFARNYLATGGGGFADTSPPEAEWLFWIDSDVKFNIEQIEHMLSIAPDKKFVTGYPYELIIDHYKAFKDYILNDIGRNSVINNLGAGHEYNCFSKV